MIEFIFYGIIGAYYITFFSSVAHAEYKDSQKDHRKIALEYDEMSREDPGIVMFLESELVNIRGNKLPTIIEEKVFEV